MKQLPVLILFALISASLTLTDEPIKKSTYCLQSFSDKCVDYSLEISKYFLFFAAKGYCDPNTQIFTDTCCQNALNYFDDDYYKLGQIFF